MRDVTITVYGSDGRPTQVFHADRATPYGSSYKAWTLHNATVSNLGPLGGFLQTPTLNTNEINKTPENITF